MTWSTGVGHFCNDRFNKHRCWGESDSEPGVNLQGTDGHVDAGANDDRVSWGGTRELFLSVRLKKAIDRLNIQADLTGTGQTSTNVWAS